MRALAQSLIFYKAWQPGLKKLWSDPFSLFCSEASCYNPWDSHFSGPIKCHFQSTASSALDTLAKERGMWTGWEGKPNSGLAVLLKGRESTCPVIFTPQLHFVNIYQQFRFRSQTHKSALFSPLVLWQLLSNQQTSLLRKAAAQRWADLVLKFLQWQPC